MRQIQFVLVFVVVALGFIQVAQCAYVFEDAQQQRLTVVGRHVVVGYASTVWHGKRGGEFFAFIAGKRMYLTANRDGEVLVTDAKANALNWDFSETNLDKVRSEYAVPNVRSTICTRSLGSRPRSLIVTTQESMKDTQGKTIRNVKPVRLTPPTDSEAIKGPKKGSVFTIRGADSRFIAKPM